VIVIDEELGVLIHDVWAAGLPVACMQKGRSWIFGLSAVRAKSGGGLDLTSQIPRWLRITRITNWSSILLMMHSSLALRTDQRLRIVYLLNQPCMRCR
jgi:hypothetical protein